VQVSQWKKELLDSAHLVFPFTRLPLFLLHIQQLLF
jgi:hypothetical protein